MYFEKDESNSKVRKVIFEDEDYTEHNKTYNRVKNYSFSRP
jgi:hypothetical protein